MNRTLTDASIALRYGMKGRKSPPPPPLQLPPHWIGMLKGWEAFRNPIPHALVSLLPDELRFHLALLGSTGMGKSNLIIHLIAQDIINGYGVIVFDFRGDLIKASIELCAGNVDPSKVKIFNLRDIYRVFGFNPLFGSGEHHFRVLALHDAIKAESDSFGVQLSETLRYLLHLLSENNLPITYMEQVFFDSAFRNRLVTNSNSDSVRAFWTRYDLLSPEKQATGYASPVLNKVSVLLGPEALRRTLGHQSPVDLGHHLNHTPGGITLVSLALDQLSSAGKMMGKVMLSAITREIFSRAGMPEDDRLPIRLYIDEVENLEADELETILAEARKYRLGLVMANQVLAQLSPTFRSLVLNNVGAKVIFGTGREDGAILSKDLTGDAKALDFSHLRTGEAYLWRRNQPLVEIEINAPLIENPGVLSEEAEQFLDEVYSYSQPFTEPESWEVDTPAEKPSRKSGGSKSASLEDWL